MLFFIFLVSQLRHFADGRKVSLSLRHPQSTTSAVPRFRFRHCKQDCMDYGKKTAENGKAGDGEHEWGPRETVDEPTITDTEAPRSPLLSPKPGEDEASFKATTLPSPPHADVENGRVAPSELQTEDFEDKNARKKSPSNSSPISPAAQEKENRSTTGEDVVFSGNRVTVSRFIKSASIPALVNTVRSAAKNISFTAWPFSSKSPPRHGFEFLMPGGSLPMKVAELNLRLFAVILSVIAFSVMSATSEERQGAGSTFKMKFTDFGAYNYLVAINVITFIYSLVLLAMLIRVIIKDDPPLTYQKSLQIYAADQVLSFLLFSASTAAATAAQLSRSGLQHIWPPACSTWKLSLFCSKADAAVAMSFFSSFCVIGSAVISAHHLSKLLQ